MVTSKGLNLGTSWNENKDNIDQSVTQLGLLVDSWVIALEVSELLGGSKVIALKWLVLHQAATFVALSASGNKERYQQTGQEKEAAHCT